MIWITTKTLRRGIGAALLLAGVFGGPMAASADPTDAICIMYAEDYCMNWEGQTPGTHAFGDCLMRWREAQLNGYCDW
jgi:hypothetical protein